jgi:HSP20 family protein
MDRLFEGSVIAPHLMGGQSNFPTANLHVTNDDVIFEMAIPGVDPNNINISISGDTVTVTGESKRDKRGQKGQTFIEEIWEGTFQRTFALPFPVDADKANATFEHGILTLTLPKSEAAKPRQIKISQQRTLQGQSAQGQTQQGRSDQQTDSDIQKERVSTGSRRSS